jgi:hypothetical protein
MTFFKTYLEVEPRSITLTTGITTKAEEIWLVCLHRKFITKFSSQSLKDKNATANTNNLISGQEINQHAPIEITENFFI